MSNISTCNNLIVSGNQTISGNIISNANLQTNIITSTSINNTGTLSSLTINGTTANVTNVTLSNILTLLAATPIKFLYNGTQYNMSALMLYTLYQLNGVNIASQNYVQTQIASLINSSPALLDTLSELASAIGNDPNFSVTMTNLIATKSALSGNNIFTGQLNTFNNVTSTNLVCSSCTVNSNSLRSAADIWEASISSTGSYIYFNNSGTIGIYNTSNSSFPWYITIAGLALLPTITNSNSLSVTGTSTFTNLPYYINTSDQLINKAYVDNRFTTLNSTTGTIATLNSTTGTIATLNSTLLNSTTGTIQNLFSNTLSVNSNSSLRSANNLLEVSLSPTTSYMYFNNAGTLGIYDTIHSTFNWYINLAGLGSFTSINSTSGTIGTINSTNATIGTINATNATVATLISPLIYSNTLMLNCAVNRAPGDILEAFPTPTSPQYLFFNNSASLGLYNTNTYSSTWSIDINGVATFTTINCPTINTSNSTFTNLTSTTINCSNINTSNLSVIKQNVQPIFITATYYPVSDTSPTMIYMSASSLMLVGLNALSSSNNYNIYEFRITTSPTVSFTTGTSGCIIIDLANNTQTTISSGTKNYLKFQYVIRNGTNYYYLLA